MAHRRMVKYKVSEIFRANKGDTRTLSKFPFLYFPICIEDNGGLFNLTIKHVQPRSLVEGENENRNNRERPSVGHSIVCKAASNARG